VLPDNETGWDTKLSTSPIISINLWFDQPVVTAGFYGLIGTRMQWLFNRDAFICGSQHNQITFVVSAAREMRNWSKEQLVDSAVSELRMLLPEKSQCNLVHSRVVKEYDATVSLTPETIGLRPVSQTSIPNLWIAGDWTATGLPATIEGAVQSGHAAARAILGK
jgi:zeta-carotene desaturase